MSAGSEVYGDAHRAGFSGRGDARVDLALDGV